MTRAATASRPLDELIADLAAGLAQSGLGVRPDTVEFDLPIEAAIEAGAAGPVVVADLPRTRFRTWFDRPLGRMTLRLAAEALP